MSEEAIYANVTEIVEAVTVNISEARDAYQLA